MTERYLGTAAADSGPDPGLTGAPPAHLPRPPRDHASGTSPGTRGRATASRSRTWTRHGRRPSTAATTPCASAPPRSSWRRPRPRRPGRRPGDRGARRRARRRVSTAGARAGTTPRRLPPRRAGRLLELFDAAARHGLVVILASWEYQQSPAFAGDPALVRGDRRRAARRPLRGARRRVGPPDRRAHGCRALRRVALVELHNEVDFSILPRSRRRQRAASPPGAAADAIPTCSSRPATASRRTWPCTASRRRWASRSSTSTATACSMRCSSGSTSAPRDRGLPERGARALLRPDAPSLAEYGRPAEWKIPGHRGHRPDVLRLRLDRRRTPGTPGSTTHYGEYREVMRGRSSRASSRSPSGRAGGASPRSLVRAGSATRRSTARFEEGPIGRALAEHGIRTALEHGVWGVVACSNAAPHHPMWADEAWQRRMNALVTAA